MNFSEQLQQSVAQALKELYSVEASPSEIIISETKKDFEGDITVTAFPLSKLSKKSPEQTGNEIGEFLKKNNPELKQNVFKNSDIRWLISLLLLIIY